MKQKQQFDYLKFEQGLAPADPWDTPENDMVALRSILGSPKMPTASTSYTSIKRTSIPSTYPQQQQQQQQYQQPQPQQPQQHPRPYQKNEGGKS
jgi:hypothetical protein